MGKLTWHEMGDPCEAAGCTGVLRHNLSMITLECFKSCSVCGAVFYRVPLTEKVAWAQRVIERTKQGSGDN